jgi:hypothetical protein
MVARLLQCNAQRWPSALDMLSYVTQNLRSLFVLGACCRLRPRKCGVFQLLPAGAKINHRQEQRSAKSSQPPQPAIRHCDLNEF